MHFFSKLVENKFQAWWFLKKRTFSYATAKLKKLTLRSYNPEAPFKFHTIVPTTYFTGKESTKISGSRSIWGPRVPLHCHCYCQSGTMFLGLWSWCFWKVQDGYFVEFPSIWFYSCFFNIRFKLHIFGNNVTKVMLGSSQGILART